MRTTTQIFGTVASVTAVIIFAPWRMIPCRSTAVPIMNPGTSARNTSGTVDIAVRRYTSEGAIDTQFGSGGGVVTSVGSSVDEAYAVAIRSDGKILVAGRVAAACPADCSAQECETCFFGRAHCTPSDDFALLSYLAQ